MSNSSQQESSLVEQGRKQGRQPRPTPATGRLSALLHPYAPALRRLGVAVLVAAVGIVALVFALSPTNTVISYRLWGLVTSISAGSALVVLVVLDATHRATPRSRSWVYAVFLLVSAVGSMLWGVVVRAQMACPLVSQECGANMETAVVERAGRLLLHTGSPYLDIIHLPHPQVADYNPYSPLMAVFGVPAGWWGTYWWTDARLYILLVTVLVLVGTWLLAGRPRIPEGALLVLVAIPPVTMNLVAAGLDMVLVMLLLLCVVAAFRGHPVLAALAGAVALGMKMTALPVVVVVAIALGYHSRQGRVARQDTQPAAQAHTTGAATHAAATSGTAPAAAQAGAVPVAGQANATTSPGQFAAFLAVLVLATLAAYLPFYAASPDAMVENIIRYTTGSSVVKSSAQGATPGQLIASTGPVGVWVARGLLLLAGVDLLVWMVKRPPATMARTFWVCAVGLTAAMLLMPASRFGYLIYPAFLLAGALVADSAARTASLEPSHTGADIAFTSS
ncbi:hypothetical protein [Lawsonella clevelandensis]|uniref:DUF2029 domain-containing protein n=1 Tax=Lawsonella clevelandensis TaxID=1528099 RepID=A0A5E3ZWW2_9ACTN|nr:hypothetical protein [Lawsonella clevelandensis]VHO00568.1 hypothetical protein LC603019_00856 [Lawsonella clevelandensis]